MTLAGRLAVAAAVALIALAAVTAWRGERLVGGERDRGEAVIDVTLPPGVTVDDVAPVWRARLGEVRISPGVAPATATVGVALSAERAAATAAALLARPGTLQFAWVADDTEAARAWFRAVRSAPVEGDVSAEAEEWRHAESGRTSVDYYLVGPTRQAIIDRLAAVAPDVAVPPELALVFEPFVERDTRRALVRSYLIERTAILSGADVAEAQLTWDPDTNRPSVMLAFTARGRSTFATATAAGLGRKLAMLIDGDVALAPVVQGVIRGGRTTITVGGDTPAAMEAEARALAAVLGRAAGGALPPGIIATVRDERRVEAGPPWAARGLLAAIVGVVAFLVAPLVRRGGLAWAPLAHGGGQAGWVPGAIALVVTVSVPLGLYYLAGALVLPGLPDAIIETVGTGRASASLGVLALGITPLVSATLVVELVAFAVPAWRRRRLGDVIARRPVDRAVAWVTVGLAAVQAYLVVSYLAQAADQLDDPMSTLGRVTAAVSLVAGTLVALQAARAISRWGLANGVVVLLAVSTLTSLLDAIPDRTLDPRWAAIGVVAVVGGVANLLANLRPPRGRRLPWGGLVPAVLPNMVAAVGVLLLGLASLFRDADDADLLRLLSERSFGFDAAVAAIVLGGFGWARYRDWQPVPAVVSGLFTALVVASPLLVAAPLRPFVLGVGAALVGAVAVELAVGAWVRLRLLDPTPVLVVHDVERADRACDRLIDAGIGCAAPGLRVRTLFRLFAAYCPIVVVVARADVAAATAALAGDPATVTDAAAARPAGPPVEPAVG
ncbi:MAG: hypothetical protein R3B06_29935 [Kofleriaceae bacterium]